MEACIYSKMREGELGVPKKVQKEETLQSNKSRRRGAPTALQGRKEKWVKDSANDSKMYKQIKTDKKVHKRGERIQE